MISLHNFLQPAAYRSFGVKDRWQGWSRIHLVQDYQWIKPPNLEGFIHLSSFTRLKIQVSDMSWIVSTLCSVLRAWCTLLSKLGYSIWGLSFLFPGIGLHFAGLQFHAKTRVTDAPIKFRMTLPFQTIFPPLLLWNTTNSAKSESVGTPQVVWLMQNLTLIGRVNSTYFA